MTSLIGLLVALLPALSWAAVTLTSVSGESNIDITTPTNPIIYGGMAGTCTSTDGSTTCDSCEAGVTTACNTRRIYPGLPLTIYFKSDSASGDALLLDKDDNAVTLADNSTSIAQGNTSFVTVNWSDICSSMDSTSACTTNDSATFTVGISDGSGGLTDSLSLSIKVHNPTAGGATDQVDDCGSTPVGGVCKYTAYPGDQKVYIEIGDGEIAGDFPNDISGLAFSHIRIFYSDVNFTDVNSSSSYQDLQVDEDSEGFYIPNSTVTGLSNGTTYFFRAAALDKANNLAYFTSDTNLTNNSCGGTPTDDACDYMGTPAEVFGLLTEDLNCFVSTAAFGSQLAPQVNTFRQFRNRFLLPYSWGKQLVFQYYEQGPKAARVIAQHEQLRTLSRWLLWPIWAWSWLSLKIGILLASLTFLAGLALPLILLQKKLRAHLWVAAFIAFSLIASPQAYSQEVVEEGGNKPSGPHYIRHPYAEKGLTKITKDSEYIYKTPRSPQSKAASLRVGLFSPINLQNSETGDYFADIYDETDQPILLFDYEWQIFQSLGKLGFKVGTGFFLATGNGVFKSQNIPAKEKFTFIAFPNSASIVYRMDYWNKQFLVPFAEAGVDAFTFAELRDDDIGTKFGAALAAHFAVGGAFSLGFLNDTAMVTLDREYGINSVWLTGEYRSYIALNNALDFSSDAINAGIMVEF